MASIAELNIRLGLLTKDFDRELKGVERKMKQAGQNLASLGSDLTAAISLPLAGLGFAAIKSAGDIESLRLALTTTMQDAGRSTADVTAELEALRVAALAPGLDFEQAIKASVRLQNVGFSAEKAREAIVGMAKAVALGGGTAEDLNEVTNQFSQMIGKGKVFQDDIKILTGRMPKLASIMKETFGTTTAEGINALGISAKDFVDIVVAEMNKLPQVAGGIKNSLVNLFVGLKLEAARIGDEINKAFNVGNFGEGVLKVVGFLVDAFAGLSDGSKKIVVSMAAVAAATGPVIFAFGKIVTFLAPIRTGFLAASQAVTVLNAQMAATATVQATLQTGAKAYAATTGATTVATQGLTTAFAASTVAAENNRRAGRLIAETLKKTGEVSVSAAGSFSGFGAVIQRVAVAFRALNVAQKILLAGGIIAAVAAIAIVYNELTHELTAAEKAQLAVSNVTQQAGEDISAERTKVVELAGVLKDQTATRGDQKRALEALKAINPEYFKGLDLEKIKVSDVDKAVNLYIDSLLRAAKAKRAFARLEELDKLRETMVEMSEPSTWQTIVNGFKSGGNSISFTALQANSLGENFVALKKDIEAEEAAMREVIKANGDFVATASGNINANETISAGAKRSTEAQKEAERQTTLYKDALISIAAIVKKGDILGAEVMSEQAKEIESQIERLLENGFLPYSKEIEHLRGMLKKLREDAGKGFDTQNFTQQKLGFGLDIPALPSIQIPTQVISVDTAAAEGKVEAFKNIQAVAIEDINALRKKAHDDELARIADENDARERVISTAIEAARTISDTIISIQQGKSKEEIRILEEEYAIRIEAAQGNNQQVAALQDELAARKEAIEKKTAKKAQGVAVGQAIVNTAQGVTKALASAPPPFNFALAALVAAAGIAEIAKIKAQAFASGGVVDRPTLALVGEYAGASNNPEIITPENKLRTVFFDVLSAFDFNFPEPREQKKIKQERPVVNIELGEVTPNNSISNTIENVFSGFKMPEINIFQTGDGQTDEQQVPGISRVFSNISKSIVMPEMPRIEAPRATITNREVFNTAPPVVLETGEDIQLTAVIRGDDLLFIVDNAAVRRGRTK